MAAARPEPTDGLTGRAHDDPQLVRVLAAWAEHDAARALHPVDRNVIRATEAARSLVLDLLGAGHVRDLFNACARLGALMAEGGASPSLAAGAIDSGVRALEDVGVPHDGSRLAAARASLIEGYVGAVRDAERARALDTWEYPACAVRLDAQTVAIACGHPTADAEALAGWAARIAGQSVKAKVRIAVLAGEDAAKAEVASALELVGIQVTEASGAAEAPTPGQVAGRAAPPEEASPWRWLRLPWRK
jgi:hypothetical protein